jgi:uncharacterized protein (UPF0333 family)
MMDCLYLRVVRHFKSTLLYSKTILTLAFILTLFSCDRVKRKGDAVVYKTKQAASETKQKISDKANYLVDKVFPTYDNGKADTENNKKRFKEHLQVDLTSDVKNIYAYGDFLGADYKVLIAFTCDQATVDEIIAVKKMQLTTSKDDDGLFFLDEFKWWDKDKIELLEPYKMGKEAKYWQYLWYDPKTKQAFYEEYSL